MRPLIVGPIAGLVLAAATCLPPGRADPVLADHGFATTLAQPQEISGTISPALQQALAAALAGDPKRAIDATRQMTGGPASHNQAPAFEVQGIALFLDGDTDGAIGALKRSIRLDSTRSSALMHLGSIELNAGLISDAREHLQAAISLDPAGQMARERLATLMLRQGDDAGAIHELQRVVAEAGSGYSPATLELADAFNGERRFAETIKLLQPVVTETLPDNRARLVLGTAYLGAGDTGQAVKVLQQATARDAKDPDVALGLGIAARAAGSLDLSAQSLENAVELKQNWAPAYYQLGPTYLAQRRYPDAERMLEKAESVAPNATIQQELAGTLLLGGKADEAITAFKTLAGRGDATPSDFVALATAYEAVGRLSDAETTYRDAVRRFAKDPVVYWRLGAMLAMQRKYNDALTVLDQGLALAPDDQHLLRDLALVQARLQRPSQAVMTATKLVSASGQNPSALLLLGTLYQDAGMVDQAMVVYRQVLTAQPQNGLALNNLAAMLSDAGNAQDAIPLAERAVAVAPDNPVPRDTLGRSLLKAGRTAAAVTALEKAHALAPENPDVLYWLAVAQNDAGDPAAARESLNAALAEPVDFKNVAAARALHGQLSR